MAKNDDKNGAAAIDEGPRSFTHLLQQLEGGALHADLSETLQQVNGELGRRAEQSGGRAKGALVLTITLVHEAGGIVGIESKFDTKIPKPSRRKSIFWRTDGDNLAPDNPRQQKLPLREVPPPPAREVPVAEAKTPRSV